MSQKPKNGPKLRNPSYASSLKRCRDRAGALRLSVGGRGPSKVVRLCAAIGMRIRNMELTDLVMISVFLLHVTGTLFLWWLSLTIFWR